MIITATSLFYKTKDGCDKVPVSCVDPFRVPRRLFCVTVSIWGVEKKGGISGEGSSVLEGGVVSELAAAKVWSKSYLYTIHVNEPSDSWSYDIALDSNLLTLEYVRYHWESWRSRVSYTRLFYILMLQLSWNYGHQLIFKSQIFYIFKRNTIIGIDWYATSGAVWLPDRQD